MEYCRKCVQPSTRVGMTYENGLCSACSIDWSKGNKNIDRAKIQKEFEEVIKYAKDNASTYDCVIGVSGGKDSTFQALYAKEKLGLNVLLVNCVPDGITEVGKKNMENLLSKGFDCFHIRNNPQIMKTLTKRAFYEYGNPVKPSEYPLYAVSFQVALAWKIPLVILGENPGLTLGVTEGLGTGGDAMNINLENTLAGGNASDWIGDGISMKDLYLYQFPDKKEMIDAGLKAIFLGYYVPEFGARFNVEYGIKNGLEGIEIPDWLQKLYGFDKLYSSIDSNMQMINKILKYYKMGFSDVTTLCSRLIREGKLNRAEAIEYVERYDNWCDKKYITEFCDYLEISETEFWNVIERWTNKDLFEKDDTGKWIPKFKVGEGIIL